MEDKRQQFLETLKARAKEAREKASAEGKTVPTIKNPLMEKLRERAAKAKAEGKTAKSFPAPNARFAELIKKMKEAKLNKIEKKEE
jgi:hypothetical protein